MRLVDFISRQDARHRLIDMGQHAFVVVTWEGRVLEPATVQPGSEQPHAPFLGKLLVFLAQNANSGHGRSSSRKSGGSSDSSR